MHTIETTIGRITLIKIITERSICILVMLNNHYVDNRNTSLTKSFGEERTDLDLRRHFTNDTHHARHGNIIVIVVVIYVTGGG